MTKRVSLDRLRDISKQRAIRRPLVAARGDRVGEMADVADTVEWPVPSEP
ncbi:MAG TPA: hypothetical protein VNB78_01055 [Sphingomicrobium sp.]|jgi:hypothetical protein|nr:hypothetical protein [Sphingomicrobium sp.]